MKTIKELAKDFSSISASDSVESAVDLMEKRKTSYLLIKEGEKIKGITTLSGLAGYPSLRLLIDCPIEPIVFVNENILLDKALKILEKEKTNFLGILDKKKLMGIISRETIISSICQELRSLDKLKDEFVNIEVHELKTPLVPIIGYLDMVLKNKSSKLSKKEREGLEICFESAKRLNNLVSDISNISKLETKAMKFEMKPVKAEKIIDGVLKVMKPAAQIKNLGLKLDLEPNLPKVYGDEERLIQALSKLVENAIKFTDRGKVTIIAKRKSNTIIISVSDTGMGMSKETIPKLFTKFFQAQDITTRKTKGTGLGLAICKEIIQAHQGKVWAESKGLGKGSTFSFTLPIKQQM